MKKSDLITSMRSFVGGGDFISRPEIAKWLRISRDRVPELVDGLSAVGEKHRRYFIPDIAERVIERRM